MYSSKFNSKKHYLNYIDCLNKVEIGDEADCLITKNNSFIRMMSIGYFIDNHIYTKVRLPIVGKRKFIHAGYLFMSSMIGDNGNLIKQCYIPAKSDIKDYSISDKDGLLVYSNVNFDIVYSKIYKKVK